ncbi:MAG: tRNA (N6-isopentenyl adenosine(37)-C2)-methylthiotransferase MiaB [Flavobacteriales bacterium]|nr:tRNA (N6-isopentenyl adenosine(37)-C2)-methylthiotransferase MiaB [Flavobacteriales bacterium]
MSTTEIKKRKTSSKKLLYIESYGCAMNFSDSEIVSSILKKEGFKSTNNLTEANLVLINTCSIRDKAEQTVRNRLKLYNSIKKKKNPKMMVGVLGCMAERLKDKLLEEEKLVDIVAGPDSYRSLPKLINEVHDGRKAINVILSKEETYADISPVKLNSNGVTAFVSIMRGCDNMCSFCVVPFTRGRERSRSPETIVKECKDLFDKGYREVTLLGQNVDSFFWYGGGLKKDFKKSGQTTFINFANLLEMVAKIDKKLRIRFSTSHPKDITDEVLHIMKKYENICKYIHLPVQSGSTRILKLMKRGYSREWYLNKIKKIKSIIPNCGISMDIISGFCSETENDHQLTLSLMKKVKYNFGYMFSYSERPNTFAEKKFSDDVTPETKKLRLQEIINLQQKHSFERNKSFLGKVQNVLIEGISKKSKEHFYGRNSENTVVVFPKNDKSPGEYADVLINNFTSATLIGELKK